MRVCELTSRHAYLILPKLARSEVKLRWHSDYYDGPIAGMVEYQGRQCWFHMCDENEQEEHDPSWSRRYLIIALTDAQRQEEDYWHQLFREKVGTNTDYDERGYRVKGELKSQASQAEFYRAYQDRAEPDYSENELLGWFEL